MPGRDNAGNARRRPVVLNFRRRPFVGNSGDYVGQAGDVGRDRVLAIHGSDFVPEGLNDRSLAVYCQECVDVDDPSQKDGMILRAVIYHRTTRRQTILVQSLGLQGERPTQFIPHPTGRIRLWTGPWQ
jgi:hypothetical protein